MYFYALVSGESPPSWPQLQQATILWPQFASIQFLPGIRSTVPGSPLYVEKRRDPYRDFVLLASELSCAGVDIDYEEFWHADFFKSVFVCVLFLLEGRRHVLPAVREHLRFVYP